MVRIEKNNEASTTFPKIFTCLQRMISTEKDQTVIYAMKWIQHLIDNFPTELLKLTDDIIKNLQSNDLQIVEISVVLIAKIVNKQDSYEMLDEVMSYLEETMKKGYNQTK